VFNFYQINKNNKIKTRDPVIKTLISGYIKKINVKARFKFILFFNKRKNDKKGSVQSREKKGPAVAVHIRTIEHQAQD
jgi:hypothetical protein